MTFRLSFAYPSRVLTEDEVRAIEEGRRQGLSGPVQGKWIDQLLQDRRERIARHQYIRTRLRQAFDYLERLINGEPEPRQEARQRQQRSGTQR